MFVRIKKLGQGGFGSVHLIRNTLNSKLVAAKFVDVSEFMNKADNIQHALKEAQYLINLDHQNIINLESVFLIKKEIILFTEYIQGGELKEYIKNHNPFSEQEAKKIFSVLVEAIGYVHSKNIVHRDLKLENILLVNKDDPFNFKIIDFGISGILYNVGGEVIQAGTMIYSPPEVVSKSNLSTNQKIDIWSMGVILFILLTKEYPF